MVVTAPLTPHDYERAARFLAAFPGETRAPGVWIERFAFWWDRNPAHQPGIARAWLLLEGTDVVGFLGAVPSRMISAGKTITVHGMSTWRVAAGTRTESLNLLYAMAAACESGLILNTTANEHVRLLLRGVRFDERRVPADGRSSLLLGWGGAPARAAGLALNLPFRFASLSAGTSAEELDPAAPELDAALDELWARTKHSRAAATVRDARFYRWYCFADTLQKKFLAGVRDGGKLRATAVFCRRSWPGKTELELLDFWSDSPAEEARHAVALIRAGKRIADREACDVIRYPHFTPALARALGQAGVWLHKGTDRRHFLYGDALPAADAYLTSLEGDYAL